MLLNLSTSWAEEDGGRLIHITDDRTVERVNKHDKVKLNKGRAMTSDRSELLVEAQLT